MLLIILPAVLQTENKLLTSDWFVGKILFVSFVAVVCNLWLHQHGAHCTFWANPTYAYVHTVNRAYLAFVFVFLQRIWWLERESTWRLVLRENTPTNCGRKKVGLTTMSMKLDCWPAYIVFKHLKVNIRIKCGLIRASIWLESYLIWKEAYEETNIIFKPYNNWIIGSTTCYYCFVFLIPLS